MNKNLFTPASRVPPPTDTTNEAGGSAYSYSPKHALAQLACTGCLSDTFYATAESQLEQLTALAKSVNDPAFLAKLAIYSRQSAFMKDMPAVLCALLSTKDLDFLKVAFPRAIDNGKMLRNFVQAIRSGAFGRKSFGTAIKRLIADKLLNSTPDWLLRASVGNDPSLSDIIKMVHPKPKDEEQRAMFGYLTGTPARSKLDKIQWDIEQLPGIVKQLTAFRIELASLSKPWTPPIGTPEIPNVSHELLTALPLKPEHWLKLFERGGWHFVRMNLNTAARQKVFEIPGAIEMIAKKLSDPTNIKNAKVFPYQILTAKMFAEDLPRPIQTALHAAMEQAVENIPATTGRVLVAIDTSGSMKSPITGHREGATSKMRCVDVASLIGVSILRRNPQAVLVAFDTELHFPDLDPADTIMTNAQKLAQYGGGGTDCSLPLMMANTGKWGKLDAVVFVSDNESWWENRHAPSQALGFAKGTDSQRYWMQLRHRMKGIKMARIDLQPLTTTQVSNDQKNQKDVLNIGGWSDKAFSVISDFLSSDVNDADRWLKEIEAVELIPATTG